MQTWTTQKTLLDLDKSEIETFQFKTYTVDSKGQTVDETEYDAKSNVICKRIYRYFEDGELEEYVEYDPFEELLERHIYVKNDAGEIERVEYEYSGGLKSIKQFSFTDLGNADKAEIRNEEGQITGYEIYILDDNGTANVVMELDASHNELFKCEKEFLENGLVSVERTFENGRLIKEERFEYDRNGNITRKTGLNHTDNAEVVDLYQYDEQNNMVYNCTHQNGLLVFENKCGYNGNNELISEEFFELDFWEKRIIRHERLKHDLQPST